mgnify:CR=1 FL=1
MPRHRSDTRRMSRVTVREIREHEVPDVAGVWRRARIDAVPEIEARLGHSFQDDLEHMTRGVLPHYAVWVAELDGRIVAVMTLRGSDLDKLYVEPALQRRGIGSLLLERAKQESPSGLTLCTHQINATARAFYEKNGFRATRFGVSPPPESEPDVEYEWTP